MKDIPSHNADAIANLKKEVAAWRSKHWITDAFQNNEGLEDACDDFVQANRLYGMTNSEACRLANQFCFLLECDPVFTDLMPSLDYLTA